MSVIDNVLKQYLPGIFLAVVITVLAKFISGLIPVLGLVLGALLIGMIAGNLPINLKSFTTGLKFSESRILELAIVLIGFGIDTNNLTNLNASLIIFIVAMILGVVLLSILLGKLFKIDLRLSVLLGAGNAICGSAAIAATAPMINAKEEEIGLSLGATNLLGTLGLVVIPAIVYFFSFADFESAVLVGATLQSIGHVAASSFSMTEAIGEWAMVVKMGRVILLIPFLLVLFLLGKGNSGGKVKFPWFVLLFIGSLLLANSDVIPTAAAQNLSVTGNYLLAISMAAIGVGIRIRPLLKISGKGILVSALVFTAQIMMVVLYLNFV